MAMLSTEAERDNTPGRGSRWWAGDPTALHGLEHDEAGAVRRVTLELLEEHDRLP